MKILLCNMSWMKEYKGVTRFDVPLHGGEYVREHGFGHEAINFLPHDDGKVYGFIQLRTGTININRLDPNAKEQTGGVLVVWRARRPSGGSVVVGWYKNATIFRERQKPMPGRSFQYGDETIFPEWSIKASATDMCWVPPDKRSLKVPVSEKGFGSRAFVSFLDSDRKGVTDFKERLLQYVADAETGYYASPTRGSGPQIDQVKKLRIEKAAIDSAICYYADRGYDVRSVERENVGYDLEATRGREVLFIEVKGTSHHDGGATVNLSPNEYRKSNSAKRRYRICIVTSSLDAPTVNDFFWSPGERAWIDENTGRRLSVDEVISADMTIT